MKKLIPALLALLLVLSMMPITVAAAEGTAIKTAADFEAIAKAGLGGVQMFDVGCFIPPGPMHFNSPQWFDMLHHAAKEARRLGLEMCLPNCSGWSSSGGPWISPSNAMKRLVCKEFKMNVIML